ncbi:hypothetical protein PDL06_03285 [Bacillus cereus group sp. TH208-1LC]|nr:MULTISPECIES: hypothetical protein [Bacillus cereus group]MDA1605200.1 hypothetical protein [Bacillus cereus group sp. TH208-1LC]
MAKIPIKPIVNGVKEHGPKAWTFIKENGKDIAKVAGIIGSGVKVAYSMNKKREENQNNPSKVHYRKARYNDYKSNILKSLDIKKRAELFQYKLEVEKFIEQINNEENSELIVKKPLHSRRMNNWSSILIQIQDKIQAKDYHEYLKICNKSDYYSDYFEGFEGYVDKLKFLLNNEIPESVYEYLAKQTNIDIEKIRKDFII